MKILIPFSGGINSTYSLYRWLTETDDDIIARYAIDTWYPDYKNKKELDRISDIVLYLKSEVRDFVFDKKIWPVEYVENRQPIRPGFKVGTWDVGKVLPRYEGYVSWSKELKPDGISIGISLENTSMDCGYNVLRKMIEDVGLDIYLAGWPTLEPIAQGDSFDWDDISGKMIGRFEQFEFMPEELRNMTLKCNPKICVDDKCRDCAYQRTYEEYISKGKTGRDFDLYCAKHGQYGPYRNLANPDTYKYRGRYHQYLKFL